MTTPINPQNTCMLCERPNSIGQYQLICDDCASHHQAFKPKDDDE